MHNKILFTRDMKKWLPLLLLFSFFAQAQDVNETIRSLNADLKNNPDAKKTASIYSDLTWYYSNVSIDSALHYGGKAIIASKKLGDSTLLAQVYSDVGAAYFRKGDFESSKANYLKAFAIRKAKNDVAGIAKINSNLGNVCLNQQQYQQAMQYMLSALGYFEKTRDQNNINVTNGNLGFLFVELRNYPKAISYLKKAVFFGEKNKLHDRLCEFYLNLGNAYRNNRDTINAQSCYSKSQYNCKLAGNKKALTILYQNMGVLQSAKDLHKSASLYEQAHQINNTVNSDIDAVSIDISIARNLIKQGRYNETKKILLKGLKVFSINHSKDDELTSYQLLGTVYTYLKIPDSAVYFNEKYQALNETILTRAALKQTAELEAKYQTAKKEKQLLQKEAESKRKTNLLLAISTLAFFIALIGFLIYRQQKIKNRQQEQEFQLKSAIAQIETQNQLQQQRLSISRDLHDNIGAQLTFIISSVDNIKYAFDIGNAKLDNKLQSISSFTQSTIVELRDTIWAMNSDEITFEDLRARILNFIEKAKDAREEIDFRFSIDDSLNQVRLSSISGMNIYRTIQEAINNAIKYSEASEITINVGRKSDKIAVEIADNGIGFDTSTVEKGNGLVNMEKRITDIGGIFSLVSEYKKGTTISLLLNH